MEIAKVEVITDGGPWATHNHPCGVCRVRKSVLDLDTGVMHPCWGCRTRGYDVVNWYDLPWPLRVLTRRWFDMAGKPDPYPPKVAPEKDPAK